MNRWLVKFMVVATLAMLALAPARVAALGADEIAKQLICSCGCTSVLDNCTHQECGPRETMLASIRQQIGQGKSEAQIVQSFVTTYGEKILAEPPKRGFNLTAWIAPFAAIVLGAGIIFLALRSWSKRSKTIEPAIAEPAAPEDEYLQRLERELKDFPEKGFR